MDGPHAPADGLVDVVVDVATPALDETLTYATGGREVPVGSRVRVPLGKRTVDGWVIGNAPRGPEGTTVRAVLEVYDEPALPSETLRLADFLRRRYVCTLREALASIAPRTPAPTDRFRFVTASPGNGDGRVRVLHEAMGDRVFSPLSAARALVRARMPMPLSELRRLLRRLAAVGSVQRVAPSQGKGVRRARQPLVARLADTQAARGQAQRRIVDALRAAHGELSLDVLRQQASVSAATVRAAAAAGIIALAQAVTDTLAVTSTPAAGVLPTAEQQAAIQRIAAGMCSGGVRALLLGITGSGKTYVYAKLVDIVRRTGGQAVVLVPEIALTPQTVARFRAEFGARVGVIHSRLGRRERDDVWRQAAAGNLDVVVGARSAVFAPLPNLRLVILDEEQEPSYKQDTAPRYHAAEVAAERMQACGGSLVLGSATPSLEAYWAARRGELLLVRLTQRASTAPLPPVELVDMKRYRQPDRRRALGSVLTAALDECLRRGSKAMLFVNRRGFAGLLICRACAFVPRCRRCAVSLVVHAHDRTMRCHVCGAAFRLPDRCARCGSDDVQALGYGTQRVEAEVRELFPAARVVRMDADSTGTRGAHGALLERFGAQADILVGTQMIAKGLDYPDVRLVGVVAADQDLHRPDFRAAERTFSLLTQVAGRAGRAAGDSRVVVQTYSPEHYAIALAARHDYEGFAEQELASRRELGYPPFGFLAHIVLAGVEEKAAADAAARIAGELRGFPGVEVLGPAPDLLPKARGEYRIRVALKAARADDVLDACHHVQGLRGPSGVRCTIVVDPR